MRMTINENMALAHAFDGNLAHSLVRLPYYGSIQAVDESLCHIHEKLKRMARPSTSTFACSYSRSFCGVFPCTEEMRIGFRNVLNSRI